MLIRSVAMRVLGLEPRTHGLKGQRTEVQCAAGQALMSEGTSVCRAVCSADAENGCAELPRPRAEHAVGTGAPTDTPADAGGTLATALAMVDRLPLTPADDRVGRAGYVDYGGFGEDRIGWCVLCRSRRALNVRLKLLLAAGATVVQEGDVEAAGHAPLVQIGEVLAALRAYRRREPPLGAGAPELQTTRTPGVTVGPRAEAEIEFSDVP